MSAYQYDQTIESIAAILANALKAGRWGEAYHAQNALRSLANAKHAVEVQAITLDDHESIGRDHVLNGH